MEQINQLKTMRDDALARLQGNQDYRLLTSLDQLIVDLETVATPSRSGFSVVETPKSPNHKSVDDVIEQMSAELDGSTDDEKTDAKISFS